MVHDGIRATVVSNGDSSQVVAEGPNHSLKFYWQQNGTTAWHPQTVTGSTVSGPPSITFETRNGAPALRVVDQSANDS